jgi:TIR domain
MAAERQRRTYAEIFIDKLKKISKGEQRLIGNKTLREQLGWDDDRYDRIKKQLVNENAVIVGRGKGGSVGLARAGDEDETALTAFISYAHEDEQMKLELEKHLVPLQKQNLIETWHDGKLKPGDKWESAISKKMKEAKIILLLISIDFINSTYCYENELEDALELQDAKQVKVIPIILRACLWNHTPFAKLQVLPKDAKAVAAWDNRDEAWTNVAAGVRQVAEELLGIKS